MMTIKDTIKYYRDVRREDHRMSLLESGAVSYRNWWYVDNPAEIWITRFITHYFPDHKKKIRFYGVMGNKKNLRETFPGVKVFFTGENVSPIVSHPGLSLDPELSLEQHTFLRSRLSFYMEGTLENLTL